MRDARINTIGEGANEVLKAFIALVGMRDIGEGFKATLDGLKSPSDGSCPTLWRFGRERLARWRRGRDVSRSCRPALRPPAEALADADRPVRLGGREDAGQAPRGDPRPPVRPGADRRRRDRPVRRPSCTIARLDHEWGTAKLTRANKAAGHLFLEMANRRIDGALAQLDHNCDDLTEAAAAAALDA